MEKVPNQESVQYPEIAEEISEMCKTDQKMRYDRMGLGTLEENIKMMHEKYIIKPDEKK